MAKSSDGFNLLNYLREVSQELKKVSWPSRQQTLQKTTLVIAVAAIVGVYLGGLDFIFTQAITWLVQQ